MVLEESPSPLSELTGDLVQGVKHRNGRSIRLEASISCHLFLYRHCRFPGLIVARELSPLALIGDTRSAWKLLSLVP